MKFGRSWEFTTAPKGPDQVTYTLKFETMKFFMDGAGQVEDTTEPAYNIHRLDLFYQRHRMWKRFIFPLPGHGNLTVRFSKPFQYDLTKGGEGTVDPFQLEFITQP